MVSTERISQRSRLHDLERQDALDLGYLTLPFFRALLRAELEPLPGALPAIFMPFRSLKDL